MRLCRIHAIHIQARGMGFTKCAKIKFDHYVLLRSVVIDRTKCLTLQPSYLVILALIGTHLCAPDARVEFNGKPHGSVVIPLAASDAEQNKSQQDSAETHV